MASIIIGGVAGWLAEMVTRSNMGVLTNIILGIVGAALATWLFGYWAFGSKLGGFPI